MPPRKLNPAQVADIKQFLAAHKWIGAKAAIRRKYKVSQHTMLAALRGTGAYQEPPKKFWNQ
jgi:hypothetical protein